MSSVNEAIKFGGGKQGLRQKKAVLQVVQKLSCILNYISQSNKKYSLLSPMPHSDLQLSMLK